jgi:hypothetical protein
MRQTHRNALRHPQIPPDAKHEFDVTCPSSLFVESLLVPVEHEKWCIDISRPRCTVMHYVMCISHLCKHKFDVTCPDALFMKTAPVPPEHEKYCINVLHPGGTGMCYVTRRYHRMQKQKFGVRCPNAFSWNPYRSHPRK